jgi:hypothetical protein
VRSKVQTTRSAPRIDDSVFRAAVTGDAERQRRRSGVHGKTGVESFGPECAAAWSGCA